MRKALELNYELVLPVAGGARSYWIDRVMGDGATSIVYRAHFFDDAGSLHDVIIKECYPYTAKICRETDVLTWEDPADKKIALDAFRDAHRKLSAIHTDLKLKNSTSAAMELCAANDTLYSVQHMHAGITFDKDNPKKLESILETGLALTKVVAEYHNRGLLHLDIKPENFMVVPETRQLVILFDVDTVTAIRDIQNGKVTSVPSSEGWAAPEQIACKTELLCPATDLFAIGACMFSKIVGRKVSAEDMGIFAQWEFCEDMVEDVNPRAVRLLRNILRKTIAASVKRRYQTAQELVSALEEAVKAAQEDRFVISNCPPSAVQFIGREEELAKIHELFTAGSRAVFLYGFGGMGKTELAKKYVECFGHEYDACVFQMYQPEYGLKKYIENIQIHNAEGKDFEKQLRGLLKKSRVLLIVDNFDTDDDDHLEELLSLNADILFTTRNDHSDLASNMVQIINLDALPMGQLLVLFQRELTRPMSVEDLLAAQKIVESVDNWTMIVPIIAKQIVASGKTVIEYADMMEADGFRSLDEDTEEIRIRYHGKLHRKTPMGILRYVFDVGALNTAELEALCNVSVLRYHLALTKERYRYYTGTKNLNALNRLIHAGWIKHDNCGDIISLHPMVLELIESDIERTPDTVPGIYTYIKKQFTLLEEANSFEAAKSITFALLLLSDISVDSEKLSSLFAQLANFAKKIFPLGVEKLYKLLCDAPFESTWHMNASYLAPRLAIPQNSELVANNPLEYAIDFLQKQVIRYSFLLIDGEDAERPTEFFPDHHNQVTNREEAAAYEKLAGCLIDVFASIVPKPRFSSFSQPQQDLDWRLWLTEYPEEYPYYRFLLKSIQDMLEVAEEYDIQIDDKYCTLANELIIHIQESLGLFAWHNMTRQQLLAYHVLSDDAYQKQLTANAMLHYTKKAQAWYTSLEDAFSNSSDPYYIYKLVLDADYGLSRSQAAVLVKHDFAAKMLFDSRLSGDQKRYLSVEFAAKQVDNMRFKYCRRPTRIKYLGKHHRNHMVLYAQLLSAAELLLSEVYTPARMEARVDILRAAFILKRTIDVELLDPKPYVFDDIVPENMKWLSELLELAEWTRTSGYIKQSTQMKHKLLDCCMELDFSSLQEEVIQQILYKLEPLAQKYNRHDVFDLLWKHRSTNRTFCVDLLDTQHLTQYQKYDIINDLSYELLWEICSRYYHRSMQNVDEEPSPEFVAYKEAFIKVHPKIDRIISDGRSSLWELCARFILPNELNAERSWKFAQDCDMTLRYMVYNKDPAIRFDEVGVEGLTYLFVHEADRDVLRTALPGFVNMLNESNWAAKDRCNEIIRNIHRIRPETKAFLKTK